MAAAREISVAGTYAVDVRPLRPADRHGTLVLRTGDAWMNGTFVYCRTDVAAHAHKLIAGGLKPAITLDRHGNVTSVQAVDGSHRVEFPRKA